jgi:hypothetical protein
MPDPHLFVARQTVIRHFILGMAIHTPAHRHLDKRLCRRFFTFADRSMAGLALDLSKNDMAPMGVEDMIGFSVNVPPGNLLPFFCKLPDLLLFRTLRNGIFVAFQANGDVRHPGEDLGVLVLMTGVAPQSLFEMLLVIESDRLVGSRTVRVGDKKEEYKNPDRQSKEEEFHIL